MKWSPVPLGELLIERTERVGSPDADDLPLLGVSNTGGLHRSGKTRISDMSRYLLVKQDWFAYNPMRINVGSLGWANSDELTGVISPDYVVFSATEKILPRLVYLFLKSQPGLRAINLEAAGSVRQRLYFWMLAEIKIPLPPLPEQQRIVAKIEELAAKADEAKRLRIEVAATASGLLRSVFNALISNAEYRPMKLVAPLVRRPVNVEAEGQYPELGIRSFGKGTFHKPSLHGMEVGTKKLYRIQPGRPCVQ